MAKGPFLPSEFAPTEFSTSADKAAFGNTFLHFVESDWKRSLFTKKFYNELSNAFGHIAHYNIHGFYETWFTSDADRLRFLCQTLERPCWGQAKFTFCDVERAIQREVRARNYVARYEIRVTEAVRSAEMGLLRRLEAKYRKPGPSLTEESLMSITPDSGSMKESPTRCRPPSSSATRLACRRRLHRGSDVTATHGKNGLRSPHWRQGDGNREVVV